MSRYTDLKNVPIFRPQKTVPQIQTFPQGPHIPTQLDAFQRAPHIPTQLAALQSAPQTSDALQVDENRLG